MACVLALVVSLSVEALVEPYVTMGVKAAIALIVFFPVAYVARRQLVRLRDGE
jgi:hypothetical protein